LYIANIYFVNIIITFKQYNLAQQVINAQLAIYGYLTFKESFKIFILLMHCFSYKYSLCSSIKHADMFRQAGNHPGMSGRGGGRDADMSGWRGIQADMSNRPGRQADMSDRPGRQADM
jgi:hypothetical protein